MTCVAIGRCAGVLSSNVTAAALCRQMSAGQFEIRLVVIECCRTPRRRRMAYGTIVIKISRYVVRIGDTREICLMTRIANARGPFVLTILVAEETISGNVRPGQGKIRAAVIERGRFPCDGRVTRSAVVRELSERMVRCNRFGKIVLMT